MKLAVMQPYLFPYLGYFQLVHAVDTFVFLDDVTFRKQGWINRNRILVAGSEYLFSVPLRAASSSIPICRTMVDERQWPRWREKFIRTLRQSYAASSTLPAVLEIVDATLEEPLPDIGTIAARSVRLCCEYLDVRPRFLVSSVDLPSTGRTGTDRIIGMSRDLGASCYVNAPGGTDLYDEAEFTHEGIELRFLAPCLDAYPQPGGDFVPGLSILDLLLCRDRVAAQRSARRGSTS